MADNLLPGRYAVGAASVDAGGIIVTPTGATWTETVWGDDLFFLPSQPLVPPQRVESVNEDGAIVLAYPWPGVAATEEPYEVRYVGIIERSTAQSRRVLEQLGDVKAWYDIIVADDASRLALETESSPLRAGYRVLVKDDGVIWAKKTTAYGDWIGPVEFKGDMGNKGWSPVHGIAADGERRVWCLIEWVGGEGAPPVGAGKYVGPAGLVDTMAEATNVRGPAGANGTGTVANIVAGDGIDVDNSDPANPVISAEAQEITIIAGPGVSVDITDPTEPIISVALSPPQGRLTTASGIAVMTSNALGATTLYYTPCNGDMVPIYDGAKFVPRLFAQLSQTTTDTTKSPAACAANTNYDLFVWDDGGTLRCTRGPAWSNSGAGTSARGTGAGTTELDFSTPFPTNKNAITNGPAANRGTYVGSIRTNGSSQIDMSFGGSASGGVAGFSGIWNMYNRARGAFVCQDSGAPYTYSVEAVRQARASASNQHTLFFGLSQDAYTVNYSLRVDTPATSGAFGQIGIGLNSKTTFVQRVFVRTTAAVVQIGSPYTSITRTPQLGHVVLAALENADSSGNVITFNQDSTMALQAEAWW